MKVLRKADQVDDGRQYQVDVSKQNWKIKKALQRSCKAL
jgi:hypothetical protein